jgi:hypothetical protein
MRAPAVAGSEDAPRVATAGASLSLIVPIRLALGAVVLVGALAAGASPRSAAVGFAFGAALLAFAALADRRYALFRAEPEPLPQGAHREVRWRVAWRMMLPSTVVVTVLAVATLAAGSLVLASILGGGVAGMGVAAAVTWVRLSAWQSERRVTLFWEQGGAGRRFVEPRGVQEPTA